MEKLGINMIDKKFWQGKRVYITGHTGFKGSWLSLWLSEMGAIVKGFALPPPTNPSLFEEAKVEELIISQFGDIRDFETLKTSIQEFNPDILFHLAAQPLVRHSYKEPLETYDINVIGTAKVLEATRSCSSLKAIISVTTDKCYENKEWVWGYREEEQLGGIDPYSSSKACAELVTAAYRRSFIHHKGIGLASARAGNVIGGGDWATDRLIPDILRAFEKNQPAVIRNPESIRPWQHVLEPLSGYLVLAKKLYESPHEFAEAWNFGPNDNDARPVNWIIKHMVARWPGVNWHIDQNSHPHEASYLKLDISKAKFRLDWQPTWSLDQTLDRIIEWHQSWLRKANMQQVCMKEIKKFMKDLHNANN
jgi:CDP-glucose 4,6-dehydratase